MDKDDINFAAALVGAIGGVWACSAAWHFLDGWWGVFPAIVLAGVSAFFVVGVLAHVAIQALAKAKP